MVKPLHCSGICVLYIPMIYVNSVSARRLYAERDINSRDTSRKSARRGLDMRKTSVAESLLH